MESIEKYIKDQLEEIDITYLVREEIRKLISTEIKQAIAKSVRTEIDTIIHSEVEIYMAGEVKTDDGWGKKETYPSLEGLFKRTFKERVDSSYDIKSIIIKIVKEKVAELYINNAKKIAQKITEELADNM